MGILSLFFCLRSGDLKRVVYWKLKALLSSFALQLGDQILLFSIPTVFNLMRFEKVFSKRMIFWENSSMG